MLVASPAFADVAVSLSGTVLDQGAPIPNAGVYLYEYDQVNGYWYQVDSAGSTDTTGTWHYADNLSDGSYAVVFQGLGDTAAFYSSNTQTWDGKADTSKMATEFTVNGSGASASTFSSTLVRNAGAVAVPLRDAVTGGIIANPGSTFGYATFYSGLDASGDYISGSSSESDNASFTGTVLVGGLLPGTYYQGAASADGYATEFLSTPVTVAAGATSAYVPVGLVSGALPSVSTLLPNPQVVTVTGNPKVGTLLTASVPASATAATFAWYENGTIIPGATAATFVPTAAQLGQTISASAIVRAPGYRPVLIYSDSTKSVQIGDPNQAVVKVTGTTKIGHTLSVAVTGSTVPDSKLIYQWYRAGAPIGGAVGSKYLLAKADVGQKIFASVTAFSQGHTDSVIPSVTVSVAHDKATLAYSAKKSISKSSKLKVKVNLKNGVTKNAATGTVRVYYSAKKFKKLSFSTKSTTKTATLPKLSKGKHTIKIKYYGDTHYLTKSTSFKVTVN